MCLLLYTPFFLTVYRFHSVLIIYLYNYEPGESLYVNEWDSAIISQMCKIWESFFFPHIKSK